MSYEGRVQCICVNGHYFVVDAYASGGCHCGRRAAWANAVDDTNCDSYGEIPMELLVQHFQISPEQRRTCDMGHAHVVAEALFRAPTYEEAEPFRHHRPEYGNSPLIPLPRS